ncbi:MAG: DNA polymerase III subunit gamma/tau [Verrucomicrobiota bacterium]
MAYQVLARKYRPQTFDEIVGQDHVVRTLRNAIETDRIAHAFLFVGPRGIGKTSTARILAMALNAPGGPSADFNPEDDVCREIAEGRSMDVLEIDGASNNNVDQIRELRDNVQYTPTSGKFKIYIIDEVHMLSQAAFNALLKTLEEPPAHVKFIFATTEPHKVLATILSRCQRFDLKRISDHDITAQLQKIADAEKIQIEPEALRLIARNAEGGMRDAESAFDQLISFCGNTITEADALEVFGLTSSRDVRLLAEAIQAGASEEALHQVRELVSRGKELTRLSQELLRYFRNLLVFIVSPATAQGDLDEVEFKYFHDRQPLPSQQVVLAFIDELILLEEKIRFALVKEVLFEIAILRMTQQRERVQIEEVIHALANGKPIPQPSDIIPTTSPSPAQTKTQEKPIVKSEPAQATAPKKTEPQPQPTESKFSQDPITVWQDLQKFFHESKDLVIRRGLDACDFVSYESDQLVLKMVASKSIYQALMNSAAFEKLEKEAKKRLGSRTRITIQFEEREEAPLEPSSTSDQDLSNKEEPQAKTGNSSQLSQADFENDPLIRSAMEAFEARIVDIKQK